MKFIFPLLLFTSLIAQSQFDPGCGYVSKKETGDLNAFFEGIPDDTSKMKAARTPGFTLRNVALEFEKPGGIDDRIEISIKDNDYEIPDTIKEKIFQPFFTAKPTGQGTGLGLSLSYDIVKAHGGTIEILSAISAGTVFHIALPV